MYLYIYIHVYIYIYNIYIYVYIYVYMSFSLIKGGAADMLGRLAVQTIPAAMCLPEWSKGSLSHCLCHLTSLTLHPNKDRS